VEEKMFGIGMPELIIILVIALVVIGPKKLPDLAKALGKGLSEFKKATSEIKEGLNLDEDLREAREDLVDAVSGLDKPEEENQNPPGKNLPNSRITTKCWMPITGKKALPRTEGVEEAEEAPAPKDAEAKDIKDKDRTEAPAEKDRNG
jgi:TatA/E family protein of Tat protein translocase